MQPSSERTIGNYRIVAQLGEGGMGVVYLGEHLALGRKAAIKVLREQMAADPEVVSRFFHEARASTAIRHPNIVEIYDYGTLPDGASYIVMEYLEGESLAARLRRGRIAIPTAVSFVWQAAAALAVAHDRGIVHRDLKPENLFVTPDVRVPGEEQIKILDFGIAKLDATGDAVISHKTRTGVILGTPLYMSPEQCLGVREVDFRTDIYSLGCIFFEMLCGSPPFFSVGFGALLNMHINQPPEAPSRRNPNVPEGIDRAVLRALAKDAGDRFATMSELQEAIAPFMALGHEPAPLRSRASLRPGPPPVGPAPSLLMKTTLSSSGSSSSAVTAVAPAPAPGTGTGTGTGLGPRRRLGRRAVAVLLGGGGLATAVLLGWALGRPAAPGPAVGPAPAGPAAGGPAGSAEGTTARVPTGAPPAAATGAPESAPAPSPAPAPVPAPKEVDIALASEPAGALVTIDGRSVGTTPTSFRTAATVPGAAGRHEAPKLTFVFTLDGYRREVIEAIATPGLRIVATLKRAPAGRRPGRTAAAEPAAGAAAQAAVPPPPPPPPPDDIKLER